MKTLRTLVVGCGTMGTSHSLAYKDINEFEIVGLVSRGAESRSGLNKRLGGGYQEYDDFSRALEEAKPDVVSISTYPDSHAAYALAALESGAHVFMEKPIGVTNQEANAVAEAVKASGKKLVIGYILRQHPTWKLFVQHARSLGKPLVMRMNLNQQSTADGWTTQKHLMESMSPIVDCGVHYVDIMCLMTESKPVRVQAIGARLSEEIDPEMYNYGQLQVVFEDGSVGWYEAGWGPMMSETAYFVKDVVGPEGAVSIVAGKGEAGSSSDIDSHTAVENLKIHTCRKDDSGAWKGRDTLYTAENEPDHNALCRLEQEFLRDAIRDNLDIADHVADAVNSLRIVLAADQSVRTGKTVVL